MMFLLHVTMLLIQGGIRDFLPHRCRCERQSARLEHGTFGKTESAWLLRTEIEPTSLERGKSRLLIGQSFKAIGTMVERFRRKASKVFEPEFFASTLNKCLSNNQF